MLKHRVIPCLLLKDNGLVKSAKFKDHKYVGDPINAIKIFNDKEVDELMVLDISASKEQREPNYELINEFASECFSPLCYGGGICRFEQAQKLFKLGVEKVCLQSAALENLSIITDIARVYGSQAVVVSIDIKKSWLGKRKVYRAKDGKLVDRNILQYLKDVEDAGAGEIILNSVDADGLMEGMDLELIRQASEVISLPLIAAGGVGSLNHIKEAVDNGASAVAAGAFFVFQGPHRAVLITYPKYTDLEKLFEVG